MKEFVEAGANPFEPDEKGHNAIFYANLEDPIKTGSFLLELAQLIDKYKKQEATMSNKNLLLSLTTIALAACSIQQKTIVQTNDKYLACYALNPATKGECLNSLVFEVEKLGFKQFLNNLNLPCEGVKNGPEFVEEKKA